MRAIKAIVLVLLMTAPFVGTWAWLNYHKGQLRHTMKHRMMETISPSELVTFNFTPEQLKTELEWEHNKEFEYKGEMFDVVRREESNGRVFLVCWPDNEETAVNKSLDDLVAQLTGSDPVRSENRSRVVDFYRFLYCESFTSLTFAEHLTTTIDFTDFSERANSIHPAPPTPPPRA